MDILTLETQLTRILVDIWNESVCFQSDNDENHDCERLLDLRCHLDTSNTLDLLRLWHFGLETQTTDGGRLALD